MPEFTALPAKQWAGLAATWPLNHRVLGARTREILVNRSNHIVPRLPPPARRVPPKVTSNKLRIVGNEMQIDSETIRLSCEPFRRGPVFKSQPDCLAGNLHSINQRNFLFKLELFFFLRSPRANYSSSAALQRKALGL